MKWNQQNSLSSHVDIITPMISEQGWSPTIKQHHSGKSHLQDEKTIRKRQIQRMSNTKSHESRSKSQQCNCWFCCSLFGGDDLLMDLDLLPRL